MKHKRIYYSWLLLVLLLAGALVGLWRGQDVSRSPSMFTDLPAAEAPSSFPEQSVARRHRWVRLDQLGMQQLSLNPGEQKRVVLNLFPDLEVEAVIMANKTHWNKDQSAFGLIENSPDSLLVMSFHQDVMMGVAIIPDGRQVLISHVVDDKYVIVEVDPLKVGGCGNCAADLPRDKPGLLREQKKAASPAGGVKTSAAPQRIWSRRLAMADPRVLKEATVECRKCPSPTPAARVRPLLAALGAPPALLAAGTPYTLNGPGGSVRQNMGPTSAHTLNFMRSGYAEHIDILFVFTDALRTQEGGGTDGEANIQAKVTRMVDTLNAIFTSCSIALEVRQAGLVLARNRAMTGGDDSVGFAAWERNPAFPVPVRPDYTNKDNKQWTVWNRTFTTHKQAIIGVYQPKYQNLIATHPPTDGGDYDLFLNWIVDDQNSLLYGDQYWDPDIDDFFPTPTYQPTDGSPATPQPPINLPEGFQWRLEPYPKFSPTQAATPLYTTVWNDPNAGPGTFYNPGLSTGPVDMPDSHSDLNHTQPGMAVVERHSPVQRYEYDITDTVPSTGLPGDAVNDTYGSGYNPAYSGVLGLRMDLNNTGYDGQLIPAPGQRYPVLHGQRGDFDPTFNINGNDPTKQDARADIVCVLGSNGMIPSGTSGVAWKYTSLPGGPDTSGRGPAPQQPNDVQWSPYEINDGEIITGVTPAYVGTFSGADLSNVAGPGISFDDRQGLVAYYPFTDGSLLDFSTQGNNAAQIGAPPIVLDRHNSIGLNDARTLSSGNTINTQFSNGFPTGTQDFTLSLWLRRFPVGSFGAGERVIVANQSEKQFELRVNNNGQLRFYTGAFGTSDCTTPVLTWIPSTWYHVVVTRSSNRIIIYRDGALSQTGPLIVDGGNSAVPSQRFLTFGDSPGVFPAVTTDDLTGSIDDVRLYNYALTGPNVSALHDKEKPLPGLITPVDKTTGLTAYFPVSASLYGDTSNIVHDQTAAQNHGTVFQADWGDGREGPTLAPNGAYLFNGPTDYLQLCDALSPGTNPPLPALQNQAFTISLWANATALPTSGTQDLLGNRSTGDANAWWVSVNTSGLVTFNAQGTGGVQTATSDTSLVPNTWQQVIITRAAGGGNVQIYIDGVSDAGIDGTVNPNVTNTGKMLWAGNRDLTSSEYFNGKLDEIRIYIAREFADWEAKALYDSETITIGGSAIIKVTLGKDENLSGDSMLLELFNGAATAGNLFYSQDYNSTGKTITYIFPAAGNGNAWQQFVGSWRITPQSGSVLVESVEITIVTVSEGNWKGTITPPFTLATNELEHNIQVNRDSIYHAMVVKLSAGVSGYTFGHELGHVLGCSHGIGDKGRGPPLRIDDPQVTFNHLGTVYPFVRDEFLSMGNHFMAFGIPSIQGQQSSGAVATSSTPQGGTTGQWGRYATIMAYDWMYNKLSASTGGGLATSYTKIPRYSGPQVLWKGSITGDSHGRKLTPPHGNYGQPLYTDNTHTIRIIGKVASYYRDDNGSSQGASFLSVPVILPKGIPDGSIRASKPGATTTMAKANNPSGANPASSIIQTNPNAGSPSAYVQSVRTGKSSGGIGGAVTSPSSARPVRTVKPGGGIGGSVNPPTTPPANPTVPPNQPPAPTQPAAPPPATTVRPKSGGLGVQPPKKSGGGNRGAPVPNDSRQLSLPMNLRVLPDRSYFATVAGHNRGATGREDAALRTDDARPAFHGRSVWWHVTVPATGEFELLSDTHGSAIDTTLSVWLPDAARPLANDNDPRRPGPASAVRQRINLRKGQKIILAIDGVDGAQGLVKLNVRLKLVK